MPETNKSVETQSRWRVLDQNNLIPLGHLGVLIVICIGGASWATEIRRDIAELKVAVQKMADGEWSRRDMYHYIELLRAANRGVEIVFPQVETIK